MISKMWKQQLIPAIIRRRIFSNRSVACMHAGKYFNKYHYLQKCGRTKNSVKIFFTLELDITADGIGAVFLTAFKTLLTNC